MYNSSNATEDKSDDCMKIREYIMKCIEIAIPDGFMSAVKRNVDAEEIVRNSKDTINSE